MCQNGTPLIKSELRGWRFWTDEPLQNLMGGEYFHFKNKGLRKRRRVKVVNMQIISWSDIGGVDSGMSLFSKLVSK